MAPSQPAFLPESQLLLNAAGEGIYGFDLEGNAIFINPAAEAMTGWRAEDLLGKQIHQFHHHSHADGSPYPAHECQIYATLTHGEPRVVTNEVFWRKDGSCFPVEYTSTPIYQDGKLAGAVAIFRDVSQQKQTEQALREALAKVQQLSEQLSDENHYLKTEIAEEHNLDGMVGNTPQFLEMMQQIQLVAATDSTVLVEGESGTGKELVARNLHQLSQRRDAPLVKVNCAAFSASLLESELFGHEKGAFTGATERRKGRFELADKGTLFLDEVGELPPEAQSKLLRVLQEQEFERVGGTKTLRVDIRVVAATNRDLKQMVEEGKFRMDLYYRLNVFPINVPALRERIADLPLISQAILAKMNQKLGKQIRQLSPESLVEMMAYSWPGNIRELQNLLEREVILCREPVLALNSPLPQNRAQVQRREKTLAQMERDYIQAVLVQQEWRIGGDNGAARLLGLPDSTLRSKMQKLGIQRPTTNG